MELLRVKTAKQSISILDNLQKRHLIEYSTLGHGKIVKFNVINWCKVNRVLDYNAPCQKDTGFFFLPISVANELVSCGKCSEMDAVLDLWINTIYNDKNVQGSEVSPLVYIRNGTGNPILTCEELAQRWGLSKATVSRYLNKLKNQDYIMTVNGVTVTIHDSKDIPFFMEFDKIFTPPERMKDSLRLNIFKGVGFVPAKPYWNIKYGIEWIKNCPLPKGEVLMRYKK